MELSEALGKLSELQRKQFAYKTAKSSLYVDSVTVAPKGTAEGRGIAMGVLAGEQHKLLSSAETGELLNYLEEHAEELDPLIRRQVVVLKRSYDHLIRVPLDEYMAYAALTNEASNVWHRAKEESNFPLFQPILEKIVEFNRRFATYYDSSKAPYDTLLAEYEHGVDTVYLDQFFAALREKIVPLLHVLKEKEQPDDHFLYQHYPLEAQRKFADYLMEVMQLDRNHCTIGETEHPFTRGFNNKDVRITTNYKENEMVGAMYSVIHEGGHAKYHLGNRDELQYTCLSGGASMGIQESQSRFYENIIGRSLPFIGAIYPRVQGFFPEQLGSVTAEQFYRAVNKVQPSLIRIKADELTYSLHIMIRYEIEKMLIEDTLQVADVPEIWNRLYKEYLGVDVPDDKRGCLQDSHWSGGLLGYFPSYALGSAYGAQMLQCMEKDIDVWGPVSRGDLTQVSAWLKEKIHQHGASMDSTDVIRSVCGEFQPMIYVDYLTRKYSTIYGL